MTSSDPASCQSRVSVQALGLGVRVDQRHTAHLGRQLGIQLGSKLRAVLRRRPIGGVAERRGAWRPDETIHLVVFAQHIGVDIVGQRPDLLLDRQRQERLVLVDAGPFLVRQVEISTFPLVQGHRDILDVRVRRLLVLMAGRDVVGAGTLADRHVNGLALLLGAQRILQVDHLGQQGRLAEHAQTARQDRVNEGG